ncbi:hypothetical protein [Mesorhizobium sp. B2-6-5]|uniref:hypothetical protein n=1 Tax=Mesorhizobium sp. B2-6-5 TaxID=2589912 RepID=UPI00112D7C4A|nr:hypothetical protein [Mesorhizobium sp. B2-6-5]TPJ32714.1 hypothetical protein FJ432_32090 [Mesorhizobium sp. B2-6-5]
MMEIDDLAASRQPGLSTTAAREIVKTIPCANYLPRGSTLEDGCRAIVAATREATKSRKSCFNEHSHQ